MAVPSCRANYGANNVGSMQENERATMHRLQICRGGRENNQSDRLGLNPHRINLTMKSEPYNF